MSSRNIKEKIPHFKPPCKKDLQIVIERLRGVMQSSGAKTTMLDKKFTKVKQKTV